MRLFASFPHRGSVLDIGAGEGALSLRLRQLGYTVRACDLFPEHFRAEGIVFDRVDLNASLPYPDASFDALACVEVIEHLENPFAFVRECARILKPGGRMVLSTPNVMSITSRLRFFFTGFPSGRRRPLLETSRQRPWVGHINLMPYYELRYALHTCGFQIEEVRCNPEPMVRFLLLIFRPIIRAVTAIVLAGEKDFEQRRRNRDILNELTSPPMLLGHNIILVARRVAPP